MSDTSTVQTQPPIVDDASRSQQKVQSYQRLPRLKRCSCCLGPRHTEFLGYRYNVCCGAAVASIEPISLNKAKRILNDPPEWLPNPELVRVVCLANNGFQYEVIRGGRWVNEWQGKYGVHEDESREWKRKR